MVYSYSLYPVTHRSRYCRIFGTKTGLMLGFITLLGMVCLIKHVINVNNVTVNSELMTSEYVPPLTSGQLPQDEPPVPEEFLIRKPVQNYINYLKVERPQYLKNYRNPCWVERRPDKSPYSESYYYIKPNRHRSFIQQLDEEWEENPVNGSEWRIRCLPYFYIAGMPKCGSTDLYFKLILHPSIHSGHLKEVHWWAQQRTSPEVMGDGPKRYVPIGNYADIFDRAAQYISTHGQWNSTSGTVEHPVVFGEGSPSTFWKNLGWQFLPENSGDEPTYHVGDYIHHVTPEARIITTFREPVSRLYSDYIYFHHIGKSGENFHMHTLKAIAAFNSCLEHNTLWACMNNSTMEHQKMVRLRAGIYAPHVQAWFNSFPRKQLFFGRLEDFMTDQVGFLDEVAQFLGLEPFSEELAHYITLTKQSNSRSTKKDAAGPMLDETRQLLTEFYAPYNQQLADLLKDNKYLWEPQH